MQRSFKEFCSHKRFYKREKELPWAGWTIFPLAFSGSTFCCCCTLVWRGFFIDFQNFCELLQTSYSWCQMYICHQRIVGIHVPSENSSEIHFTIKSPIETGKWGNWAGQSGGGGLYIPVNSELRMINTCPKKQEWNINKAPPQQSFWLYIQDKFKTN